MSANYGEDCHYVKKVVDALETSPSKKQASSPLHGGSGKSAVEGKESGFKETKQHGKPSGE